MQRPPHYLLNLIIPVMVALPSNAGFAAAPITYTAPSGLTPHDGVAMVTDPIGQRVLLTGGLAADAAAPRDCTWEWDGLHWSQRPIASPPTARGRGIAFDALRSRVIMTGDRGTTWAFESGSWRIVSRGGLGAATGFMAYDAGRDRAVLVGGAYDSPDTTGVWEFDGAGWTFIPAPTPRPGGPLVHDPGAGGVVLVERAFSSSTSHSFVWSGDRWNMLPGTNLPPRNGFVMAWDSSSQALRLFGGFPGCACDYSLDQWVRTPTGWTQSAACTPLTGGRFGAAGVFDPVTRRLLVRGGVRDCATCGQQQPDQTSATLLLSPNASGSQLEFDRLFGVTDGSGMVARVESGTVEMLGGYLAECPNPLLGRWVYEANGWSRISDSAGSFSPSAFASNSESDACYVLTGNTVFVSASSAAPFVPFSGPLTASLTGAAMAFDSARDELVVFGGWVGSGLSSTTRVWSGKSWTESVLAGPSARFDHGMVYDPVRRRIVLSGGRAANGGSILDTWEWDGSAWHLAAVQGPVTSKLHYDPSRETVVAFGTIGPQSGLFTWNGSAWQMLVPNASLPFDARFAAYEARTDSFRAVGPFGGTWTLDLTPDAPFVTQHPGSAVLLDGATANLDVLAVGQPGMSYQWRHNGQPLVASGRIPIVDGPRLTIAPLESWDEGVYDAVVTDSAGVSVSSSAWLIVLLRCPSDFTADSLVDTRDLLLFLGVFGLGGPEVSRFDLNADGVVNTPDLVRFLGDYGRAGECP